MRLIFVYGTLKRGGSNHRYLAGQKYVGDARTSPGFRLVELDGYPGMVSVPDDDEGVTGEVWRVDDKTLAQLDAFEGVDEGLYRRGRVPLLPPFNLEQVECYYYARDISGRRSIGSTWT
jgi:gamma-glutamylcyclotransferase (GGCT)/AIG2-like uncharacterized protein YtfP